MDIKSACRSRTRCRPTEESAPGIGFIEPKVIRCPYTGVSEVLLWGDSAREILCEVHALWGSSRRDPKYCMSVTAMQMPMCLSRHDRVQL